MMTISKTTAPPTSTGSLRQALARLSAVWQERRTRAAVSGMSEREFQDIGWGAADRWSAAAAVADTAEERHARQVALRAWGLSRQKAA